MDPIQDAIALIKQGDPREARNILVEYLKANPDDPRGWALLARIVTEPRYKEELLKRVLALPKDDSGVYEWASKQLAHLRFGDGERFDPNVTQTPMATQELAPAYEHDESLEETRRGEATRPFANISAETDVEADPDDETRTGAHTTRLDRDKIAEVLGPAFDDEEEDAPNRTLLWVGLAVVLIISITGIFVLGGNGGPAAVVFATETPTPTITPTLVPIFTPTPSEPTLTPPPTPEPSPTLPPPLDIVEADTRLLEKPADISVFGQRVALSESTLAVAGAAPGEEGTTPDLFLLVYRITGTDITEEARLPFGGGGFDVDGDRVAFRSENGAVSLYERDDEGAWNETTVVSATVTETVIFGSAISLSGDVLAVSALDLAEEEPQGGAVYIYERSDNGTWQLATTLESEDATPDFGTRVLTNGGTVAVTSPRGETPAGKTSGLVYVYVSEEGEWLLRTLLYEEDGEEGDLFGAAIALDEDLMALTTADRVLVYEDPRGQGEWEQANPTPLPPPEVANTDGFGQEVTIADGLVITTAPLNASAVLVYAPEDEGWQLERAITSSADVLYLPADGFIATSGGLIAVVAPDVLGGSPAILLFSLAAG